MGVTLADGGLNPVTGEPVTSAVACRCALAVMASAGMYETSGDWLYDVGVPGKSGIGGGIVTVAPGKGGPGTFSPRLDRAGNSVRGQLAARFLSRRLGLSLLPPARPTRPGRFHASQNQQTADPERLVVTRPPTPDADRGAAFQSSRVSRCSSRPISGCSPR
jgi:hypothetical protein